MANDEKRPNAEKRTAKIPRVHPLLAGSSTARALVRIAGTEGRSEFDMYNEYMTTIGGFVPTPNPKGDVALNLAALLRSRLLVEERSVLRATDESLEQVKRVPADDITADLVRTPAYEMLVGPGMTALGLSIACCSTSTSCKCSSSSCSSSIKTNIADLIA